MEKIPTIEEYFKTEFEIWNSEYPELKAATHRKLLEYTALHTQAALEAANKQVDQYTKRNCDDHTPFRGACVSCGNKDNWDVITEIDELKDAIESSYLIEEVK